MRRDILTGMFKVASGNAFRQAVIFLSMLVVARIYSKESIGDLTLFSALINIFQHVVFMKGEFRLITERYKYECVSVFSYALVSLVCCCVFLALLFSFYQADFLLFGFYFFCFFMAFIPLLIEKLLARDGDYLGVAGLRVGDGLFQSLVPLLLSVFGEKSKFLILGRSGGGGMSLLMFSGLRKKVLLMLFLSFRYIKNGGGTIKGLCDQLSRNKYLISSGFITALSINLPVVAITVFYSAADLGFYGVVSRVLGVPVTLIAASLSTVFIAECNKVKRSGEGGIIKLMLFFSSISFVLGFFVFLGGVVFGEGVELLLGDEWLGAGALAFSLALHFSMQMFVNPISTIAITYMAK